MQYKDFANWIKEKEILKEFDLSEILLKNLFTFLDPHKKGHLTRLDWVNSFCRVFPWVLLIS